MSSFTGSVSDFGLNGENKYVTVAVSVRGNDLSPQTDVSDVVSLNPSRLCIHHYIY